MRLSNPLTARITASVNAGADHRVRERLPPVFPVGVRHMGAYGQHRVEEQHPLLRPGLQRTVRGNGKKQIVVQFPEDVAQRRRKPDAGPDGKRQTVRLSVVVIGILPENHDFHAFGRGQAEGAEKLLPRGENLLFRVFPFEKSLQFPERGRLKRIPERNAPGRRQKFGKVHILISPVLQMVENGCAAWRQHGKTCLT